MAEDFLYMANRASVEKKLGRSRMPHNMRCNPLLDARELAMAIKIAPKVVALESGPAILADEQGRTVIASGFQIPFDPPQRPVRKKHSSFLVAFANDACFLAFEVNAVAVQRKRLRDAHGASKWRLDD